MVNICKMKGSEMFERKTSNGNQTRIKCTGCDKYQYKSINPVSALADAHAIECFAHRTAVVF